MLEARAIGMRVGDRWLWRGLDLAPAEGEVLGLLGRNGVGKTSLLRCLIGLRSPDEGRVARPDIVGYVPQHSEIGFAYTAWDVVAMGLAAKKGLFANLDAADRRSIARALARVQAAHLSDRPFTALSGGERQLVLIARALVTGARYILLDEPLSALDLRHQALVLGLMLDLAHRDGLSVIFSAHDPNHLLAITDRVLVLAGDAQARLGRTSALLSAQSLSQLYELPVGISRSDFGLHVLPKFS